MLKELRKLAYIEDRDLRGSVPIRYGEFSSMLEPGDIILTKGNSSSEGPRWFRGLKQYFSHGSKWGHAAIYLGRGKIAHLFGNANPGARVALTSHMRIHDLDTMARIGSDMIALRTRLSRDERIAAAKRAKTMLGITYSYYDLIRTAIWPERKTRKDPAQLICSAAIAYAFPSLRFDKRRAKQNIRPVDFYENEGLDTIASYSSDQELGQEIKMGMLQDIRKISGFRFGQEAPPINPKLNELLNRILEKYENTNTDPEIEANLKHKHGPPPGSRTKK